ncbi:retrovirus-related pol polyprotein from transposon TNT 1-94 [Tanacetum coccineum]
MTTPIATSTTDSQMHNNIMAAGSRDRPPMLATGRYAQWRSLVPYNSNNSITQAVPATEDSKDVPAKNNNEIYSTVDACQTAQEMWEAIERLQQGESLNIQDVKTNLFWEFGQFTSHDGETTIESYYTRFYKMMNEMIRNNLTVATMQVNVQFLQQLQPEWSRFVTIVKQQHKLDEVSYHKLFDILKQYQKEVNELRAERMAKNANPLALVATAQTMQDPYYQTPKHHKSYAPTSKASLPTRSHAATRYKGKEIAKPITPPSESASEEDSDPEQAQKDKDMQKNLALIAKYFKKLYKPTNNNLRTSSNTRNKNVDTTPRYKNDNQTGQFGNQRAINVVGARETVGGPVVQQSGIQCFNCKEFGHYAKECRKPKRQSESIRNTCAVETGDSNVIPDSSDMCDNDIHQMTKMIRSKSIRPTKYSVVQAKHDELVKQSLLTRSHYEGLVKEKTKVITDLKLKEEKDIDKMISMEHQLKFLNEIVYKRSQSIQTIHMLAPNAYINGRPTFANPMYLKKAQNEHPGLYAITQDQSDPATRLIPDREEILTLAEESRSKLNKDLVKPFDYTKLEKHSISLEIALQECQVQLKNDTVCKERASNVFRKEREQYVEIQDLKAQMQDKNMAISELKKLVEKCKGKSVDTKFDKPSVVRQPNAQRIPKPSVLGKPTPFSDSLERKYFAKKKSVPKTNESEGLSKPVTLQNLPKTASYAKL